MCPDPALLTAYLDGTLFSRDAAAVDQHLSTCSRCAAMLDAMRRDRQMPPPSTWWRRPWTIGAALLAITIVGVAVWAVRPGSKSPSPPAIAPPRSETARPEPHPVPEKANAPEAPAITPRVQRPVVVTKKPIKPTVPPPEASVDAVANPDQPDAGVILRGRNANRRIVWRTRDRVIEHSIDGGATWVAEHTADHPIRAGAFVSADVAWLAGDNGLVLRRTANGWFGSSAPADGSINSVRATSPSRATVTLDDGRVFSTDNGGVTWSPQ